MLRTAIAKFDAISGTMATTPISGAVWWQRNHPRVSRSGRKSSGLPLRE